MGHVSGAKNDKKEVLLKWCKLTPGIKLQLNTKRSTASSNFMIKMTSKDIGEERCATNSKTPT